jgi:hypothetical protein
MGKARLKRIGAEILWTAAAPSWLFAIYLVGSTHAMATAAGYQVGEWPGAMVAFSLPEISWIWAIFHYWHDHGFMGIYFQTFVWAHCVSFGATILTIAAQSVQRD